MDSNRIAIGYSSDRDVYLLDSNGISEVLSIAIGWEESIEWPSYSC